MATAKDILIAMLICFGLLYLIFRQLPDSAIRNPWAPAADERSEPVKPANPRDFVEAPQASTAPESRIDRDPSTVMSVDELRGECVEEVKRGGSAGWKAKGACALYESAVARAGDPTINLSEAPGYRSEPRRDVQRAQGDTRVNPTLIAHECTGHGYGTIEYRRCRAQEKDRLRRLCKAGTERADATTGPMRQQLRQIALANCRVADLYQIVK